MANSGGLSRIYVPNDDDVDVSLFLFYFGSALVVVFTPAF
jgi:hypothetical protein